MSDDALIAWLADGAQARLTAEEESARRCAGFVQRFAEALASEDLGPTQELHDAAMARMVYGIHAELCVHGIDEYDAVWAKLSAPVRASIKRLIAMHQAE